MWTIMERMVGKSTVVKWYTERSTEKGAPSMPMAAIKKGNSSLSNFMRKGFSASLLMMILIEGDTGYICRTFYEWSAIWVWNFFIKRYGEGCCENANTDGFQDNDLSETGFMNHAYGHTLLGKIVKLGFRVNLHGSNPI